MDDKHRMKKSRQSGSPQDRTAHIRRPQRNSRRHNLGQLFLRALPGVTAFFVLTTLSLYGLFGRPMVRAIGSPADASGQNAGFALLAYAEADYQDSLILNRGRHDLDNNPSMSSTTGSADTAAADPDFTFTTVDPLTAAALPAAEASTGPETIAATEPATITRIFDAGGVPQEALPISAFTPDNTVYYVQVNLANIRELPNTSAAVLTRVTMGDQLVRLGYGLDWSNVQTAAGQTGYVLSSLITADVVVKPSPTPTPKPTPKPTPRLTAATTPGSSLTPAQQQAIVDLARSCLGVKYVYGSESPSTGFDCSGLTLYIYQTLFRVTLPRSASGQAGAGVAVSRANIQIGDIICFDWDHGDGICDHVGIYIGGGEYIHAAHSRGMVVQTTLKPTNPVVSIRRIIR